MEEYFLITYQESGDETHIMMLSMKDYAYVDSMRIAFSDSTTIKWDDVCEAMDKIHNMVVKEFWIQTYCTEDWPFGEYNIKKIMSIPEFGC
jgi:hypothetical protein